jgi:hypothetical protein
MSRKHPPAFVCPHLASPSDDFGCDYDYTVWFTGSGLGHYFLCRNCAAEFPRLVDGLVTATQEIVDRCESKGCWEGIYGAPEVKQRSTPLHFNHARWPLSSSHDGRWIDFQPDMENAGRWYVLLASGALGIATSHAQEIHILHGLNNLGIAVDDETSLSMSPRGDFGAVYQASGPSVVHHI